MKKIAIAIFSVLIFGIATVTPVKVEAGGPPIHPITQFELDPIKQYGPPIHPITQFELDPIKQYGPPIHP